MIPNPAVMNFSMRVQVLPYQDIASLSLIHRIEVGIRKALCPKTTSPESLFYIVRDLAYSANLADILALMLLIANMVVHLEFLTAFSSELKFTDIHSIDDVIMHMIRKYALSIAKSTLMNAS